GFVAVGPVRGFLTASSEHMKYIDSVAVTVPGVAEGASATVIIRAWAAGAASFEGSLLSGSSDPVTDAALGGGTVVTPNLDGLQAFTLQVIPETSTMALAALGVGALLFRRRKK